MMRLYLGLIAALPAKNGSRASRKPGPLPVLPWLTFFGGVYFQSCFLFLMAEPLTSRAPEPVGSYPYTRRVGNLLFLSGVGPRQRGQRGIPGVEVDAEGNILRYDFECQCHAVFQNVRYILEEAGAAWDDLVDVTVFLTNMKDDFPTYNRLYAEYFATAQPCRTTLEINALPTPIAIELKCIAVLRD